MAIIRIARFILILQFTLCVNSTYGQNEEFIMLPDSETIHLKLEFGGGGVGVKILKIPDEMLGHGIYVKNISRDCSGGRKIEGRQFWIELNDCYKRADTFVVCIVNLSWELQYPPEVFTLGNSTNQVIFGANCYKLNCVPDHDPWMPTAYDPFLFPDQGFYINPKNGKIRKGSRLINSGNYSICDLKQWRYISSYGLYIDKHGNKFKGSELIKRGKIAETDWNLDVFDLNWFQ